VEFGGDVLEHEHQEEEVEGIERPAQEARGHDVPLIAVPTGKCFKAHRLT
jgi:hypothetical protein